MSHSQAIGNCGKGLKTYITNKIAEYYSTAGRDNYTNNDIQRGVDLEDEAGLVYSWEKNINTEKVGFVIRDKYVGCSPDLFAGENGLGEIKCLNDKNHFSLLTGGDIEQKYLWQAQGEMLVCEKDWCDIIFYNPNFEKNLFVKRIEPDQEKVDKLLEGFKAGEKMIKDLIKKYDGL